ncbi:MAG: 16S rRNA (adenine(1518)-N(6)/adenine(1519)-N(6))-dimethyltransferase RsmA [Patescibacteria group bacterium]
MLPRAKKSYGQNFLVDQTVVAKIIQAADIKKGEMVLEIGPGTGILTKALVESGARVIAIEADIDLIPTLQEQFGETITLIKGDILSLDLKDNPLLGNGLSFKIVANIPYNITSAIIERFFTTSPRPSRMVLMVQKEVAERITAVPPQMSLLSVVCQIYAQCKRVTVVKAGAFRPMPKVDSVVVQFDLYESGHSRLAGRDPEQVIGLAKRGFASRRKQLKTNLGKNIVPILQQIGLDEKVRAENLTIEQWMDLSLGLS